MLVHMTTATRVARLVYTLLSSFLALFAIFSRKGALRQPFAF